MYISGTSLFVIFSDFLSFYFCRLKSRAERHTFTLFSNLSCARLHVPKCLIEIVYRVLHYIFKNSALHYNIRYDFDLYRLQCIKSKLLIKRIFSTVLLCSSSIWDLRSIQSRSNISNFRISRSQMFFKIGVLRNFGNLLRWLFLRLWQLWRILGGGGRFKEERRDSKRHVFLSIT